MTEMCSRNLRKLTAGRVSPSLRSQQPSICGRHERGAERGAERDRQQKGPVILLRPYSIFQGLEFFPAP